MKESWAFERDDPNGLVKQLEPYDDMMQCSVMDMNDRNPSDGVFARDGVIGDGKATVMEGFNASIQARISSIERQFLIKDMEKNGVSSTTAPLFLYMINSIEPVFVFFD